MKKVESVTTVRMENEESREWWYSDNGEWHFSKNNAAVRMNNENRGIYCHSKNW